MKIKTQKINQNLSINKIVLDKKSDSDVVQSGKNVIFAIDVSGSMYNELPKIRQQLKNKIPNLIGVNDTISIIWFSGRNQAGVLKEGVRVQNLIDIQQLNEAIDRFLVPIGLTAFLPPVKLTENVINNLSNNGNYFSFIFLSDGYNNDSVWSDVIESLGKLESKVSNSTFIEYGYYADSDSLTEMSEVMGGEKIFSKDFDSYQESFDKIVKRKGSNKKVVDISDFKSRMAYQFLYYFDNENQSINVCSSKGKSEVLVPENTDEVLFLSYKPIGDEDYVFTSSELLSSAYVLSERLKYNNVEDILINIGDVNLIKQFSGAYGKQKLNELKDKLKEYTFNNSDLFKDGKVDNYVFNAKQYCFIDLIKDLQDGDCKFFPYHDAFNYNRIGVKKVAKVELTNEMKQALAEAKTLKQINEITSELSAPEFVYPDNAGEIGMSFNTLVWNQDRANLSVQTKLYGKVKLPKNDFGLTEVDSFIYRNFTLVKDGIINVSEIPVELDIKTFNKLVGKSLIKNTNGVTILDISTLPTINRSMASNQSAKELANLEFDLIKLQVHQKYLKYLKDEEEKKNPIEKVSKWTTEVADWLKTVGITENGGFAPKVESVKSEDFYVAPVLKVKIEKTSTVPKISDFLTKNAAGKALNVVETLLKNRMDEVTEVLKSDYSIESIEKIIKMIDTLRREHLTDIAKIKFGIILSRSWFKEFNTLNDNELNIKFDEVDGELKVTFDYKEEQIKL